MHSVKIQGIHKPMCLENRTGKEMDTVVYHDQPVEDSRPLASLTALVTNDMAEVDALIMQKIHSPIDEIPDIARHLINSGGKRLRPMLTIASARMCGHAGKHHIKLAAAIEFMHTATLLHDDVVDESSIRRGKKTARLLWSNQASVLVGDFLLGQAFEMMVEVKSLDALAILSRAASVIAEGEVWQLAIAKKIDTTETDYLNVIRSKTAALFSAATEIGAVIAHSSATECSALRDFGANLGITFQLIDDVLDYTGETSKIGKMIGNDFREGKITLPVILSYDRGNEVERMFWHRVMQDGQVDNGDLDQAIAIMRKYRVLEETIERARYYGSRAQASLAVFPDSAYKEALLETVIFCINRLH